MKKKMSLMLAVILILQIMLPLLTVIWENRLTLKSIAVNTENSWDVSENQNKSIIATFDEKTVTLTISGTGKIKEEDFNYEYPWYTKKDEIAKVLISNEIENIPTRAFQECENIREITLGNSIKTIKYEAFKDCKSLSSIELPEGLENIDRAVFQNCVRLTNISIPSTVKMIGQVDNIEFGEYGSLGDYQFDVFRGCTNLESISVKSGNINYSSDNGVLFNKDKSILISYPEGKEATEYIIPSTAKKIGAYAIYNVANIKKITIPDKVTRIGEGGFRQCINLTDINIPRNVEALGNDVLDDCKMLKNITVDVNNNYYSSENGVLFNKNKTTILCYPMGKEDSRYEIPNSVTTIGLGAFRTCVNLKNITIPSSVVNIEMFAFSGCTELTNITIPNSVKKMGSEVYEMYLGYIFEGCENLKLITLPAKIDTFYTDYSFENCSSLEKIVIPEGVEYIGDGAFSGCSSLSNIKLPKSVISIGSSAFQGCSSLKNIEIPSSNPIIPHNSFHGTGLEILDIPSGITTIEDAFEKCRNLKQINIPNTVTKIDDGAFRGALLTVKVGTNSNESCEIELPEVIKRTMKSDDILYSKNGFYLTNCRLSEDTTKIIANKDMLEQGKVKLTVRSGALRDLEVAFEATTYSDTEAPVIENIYNAYSYTNVLGIGDKLSIGILTSEYTKGNPPKLKFRFGNGEERVATATDNWNTSSTPAIKYSYTVQKGDNGLLKIISFEGEELTDWSGNKLVIDNIPKLNDKIVANTIKIKKEEIKDEYHIKNKEELKNIQELITSGTFDFLGSTIYLENDMDLECDEYNQWVPIGTIYNPFRGTFEGKKHKITGIYIDSEEYYQGFFGYNSGTIKNLGIENGYIHSTGDYIGGISGINWNKAIVENCHNKANVCGGYNVGGISGGNNNGSSGKISVINCYNNGNIIGECNIRWSIRKDLAE